MSAEPVTRIPLHRRAIAVQVYERSDGLFDVEASLLDVKQVDMPLTSGLRKAGDPVHDMRLTLVVDRRLNILEAGSETLAMPYVGHCGEHGNAYAQLVGLNLLQGFRAALKQRLSGTRGCTHLTELAGILPTAVIQAFAGRVLDTQAGLADDQAPFQLDRCHALRREGPVVKTHYPRWFVQETGPKNLHLREKP
jgi:Protein of unknown function (DUF2889)